MSEHPPIIEAADAFLGRVAAMDLQAAEHVHACLLDTIKPTEVAELSRAYARASRCLRQTLALHARLKGDRERAAREAERHVAQMAREAAAPAQARPDLGLDPDQIYFDGRVEDLREAVDRVISKVADGDLGLHTRLVHRFERELDDWVEEPDFLDAPLDLLIRNACETLDLPETLARTWRDLPQPTFHPEDEVRGAVAEDDDPEPGVQAEAQAQATTAADPAHTPDEPWDTLPAAERNAAVAARWRGSG